MAVPLCVLPFCECVCVAIEPSWRRKLLGIFHTKTACSLSYVCGCVLLTHHFERNLHGTSHTCKASHQCEFSCAVPSAHCGRKLYCRRHKWMASHLCEHEGEFWDDIFWQTSYRTHRIWIASHYGSFFAFYCLQNLNCLNCHSYYLLPWPYRAETLKAQSQHHAHPLTAPPYDKPQQPYSEKKYLSFVMPLKYEECRH